MKLLLIFTSTMIAAAAEPAIQVLEVFPGGNSIQIVFKPALRGDVYNLDYAHDQRFERWYTRLMLAVVELVSSIFAGSSPSLKIRSAEARAEAVCFVALAGCA